MVASFLKFHSGENLRKYLLVSRPVLPNQNIMGFTYVILRFLVATFKKVKRNAGINYF